MDVELVVEVVVEVLVEVLVDVDVDVVDVVLELVLVVAGVVLVVLVGEVEALAGVLGAAPPDPSEHDASVIVTATIADSVAIGGRRADMRSIMAAGQAIRSASDSTPNLATSSCDPRASRRWGIAAGRT